MKMNIKITMLLVTSIAIHINAMDTENAKSQKEIEEQVTYLIKKSNKDLYRAQMFMQQTITIHINGEELNQGYIDQKTKQHLLKSFYAQQKYELAVENYEQKIKDKEEDL